MTGEKFNQLADKVGLVHIHWHFMTSSFEFYTSNEKLDDDAFLDSPEINELCGMIPELADWTDSTAAESQFFDNTGWEMTICDHENPEESDYNIQK